jgi:TRAP-type C4-dicarboxylate transport system substrate-binding protein
MTKKLVKSLEDIKGIRLRSPGPQQTLILKEFGASPLTIPMPELYNALQRGMADGAVAPFSVLSDIKLYELMRHHTVANLYVMSMGIVMNQKVWDSLPPDIQKTMDELSGARLAEIAGKSYDRADQLGLEAAKKVGAEIYTLPPAEMKRWADLIIPLNEKWMKDTDAKGLPGTKILTDAQALCRKYSK